MYCSQCGKEVAENATLCGGCGTPANSPVAEPLPQNVPAPTRPPRGNSLRNWLIGFVLLIAVIRFGVVEQKNTDYQNTQPSVVEPTSMPVAQPITSVKPKTPAIVQEQPPALKPITNPDTEKVASAEESLQCSQQAKVVFDYHYNNVTENGRYPVKGGWSYTNHFNASLGKCFMVESLYADFGLGYSSGQALYDVYENKMIGSYSGADSPIGCSLNGVYGCTKEQFSAFLNSKMESMAY